MLAGSDISEEAFSHHLMSGTGLPVQGAQSSFAPHPSGLEGLGALAEAPEKNDCNPWAIKLRPPQSLLKPNSVHLWKFPLYHVLPSPSPAGAPRAVAAVEVVTTSALPGSDAHIACPGHCLPTQPASACPYQDAAHCLDRCPTWETTSEDICQPSFHRGGTGAGTAASCSAGTGGAAVTSLDACQVLLPPGKLQVKFAESFWALSSFQMILTDSFAR